MSRAAAMSAGGMYALELLSVSGSVRGGSAAGDTLLGRGDCAGRDKREGIDGETGAATAERLWMRTRRMFGAIWLIHHTEKSR